MNTTPTPTRAASSWSQPWQIIGRGFAGWHAQAINVRSSGGTLEHYLAEAAPDCLIYDATDAQDEAFTRWTYSGPMRDPAVPAGTVDSYDPARTVATARGLDSINPSDWIARLRDEVPGVHTGRVIGGRIVWNDAPEHFDPVEAAAPVPNQTHHFRAHGRTLGAIGIFHDLPCFELPSPDAYSPENAAIVYARAEHVRLIPTDRATCPQCRAAVEATR